MSGTIRGLILGHPGRRRKNDPPGAVSPPSEALRAVTGHPEGACRLGWDPASREWLDIVLAAFGSHCAVLGVPGSGKTVTQMRIVEAFAAMGWPVVVINPKPGDMGARVRAVATALGVKYRELDPASPETLAYNPLSVGTGPEVANKLMAAFDDAAGASFYRDIGGAAIQDVARAIKALGDPLTLDTLIDNLSVDAMQLLAVQVEPVDARAAKALTRQVTGQSRHTADGLLGIRARLGRLASGPLADILDGTASGRPDLDLAAGLEDGITYVCLSALGDADGVRLMARVIVADLMHAAGARMSRGDKRPCLLVIDEFAAVGEPEIVGDLLRLTREAGMGVVIGSQQLPDDVSLRKALLSAGVLVIHHLSDGGDVEAVAGAVGTRETSALTHQVGADGATGAASLRRVHEYALAPDAIRQLQRGQAAVLMHEPKRRLLPLIEIAQPNSRMEA
jgi:hypothetical protein